MINIQQSWDDESSHANIPPNWNHWLLNLKVGDEVILNMKFQKIEEINDKIIIMESRKKFNRFNGVPLNKKKQRRRGNILLEKNDKNIGIINAFISEQKEKNKTREEKYQLEREKNEEQNNIVLKKIEEMINNDDLLKKYNITITEILGVSRDDYIVKVYFICGAHYIEGTLQCIITTMKKIVKDMIKREFNIVIFCLNCSSKKLRFTGPRCLCNECGAFSDMDENKVLEIYPMDKKQFWWSMAMANAM